MYPWTVFSGRSHTKAFIMDDIAYYGGGLNLSEASFACHDFMLRDTRPAVADQILRVMNETQVRKPQDDKVVEIDCHNKLIIDGGQPETSSILRRATELAQVAVRAWYVSQFAPDAHLLDALVAVPGETYAKYNTFHSNIGPINKIASLSNDFFARKLVNRYDGDRKIHAKCLVVELADGSLTALTGSHNLNSEGVYLGTKEISLESTDQMLCKRLIKYIETEVV
jgi:phosphatidylserine/phosphatidylglycerophosphate/cardiolipin synthase-like enzyme